VPDIHSQLIADCYLLGRFERCSVLLNRNAAVPWFILVPDTELEDVLDLSSEELGMVTEECQRISRFLKQSLGVAKTNFAGLGNVVPQMHLHIIGRHQGDACWPNPVWGQLQETEAYDAKLLEFWTVTLKNEYGMVDA
jgi:diadenosine tetraphosphate (Ap4A) HIT family hydrolase